MNSRMSQRLRYCFDMVFTRTAHSLSQNIHITSHGSSASADDEIVVSL